MRRPGPLLLLACALAIPLLTGCGNSCFKLADQICACQPDDTTRANCQARARDQAQIFPISAEDQQRCQEKIDSKACECQKLTTPEGRVACGTGYADAPSEPPLPSR
jgi:hypothetical protein